MRYLLVVGNWLAGLEVVVVTGEDLALGHEALCLVCFLKILFAHYLGDRGALAWVQGFTWSQMQLFLLSRILEKVSYVVHQVLMIENIRAVYLDTHLALFIIIQNRRLPHSLYFSVPDLLLEFFHFSLQLELIISECSYMIGHKFWLFIERVVIVLYGFLVGLQFHALLLELLIRFPKRLHLCLELHYPQRQFLHLLHWLRVTQVGLFYNLILFVSQKPLLAKIIELRLHDLIELIKRWLIQFRLLLQILIALYHLNVIDQKWRLLKVKNVVFRVFLHC